MPNSPTKMSESGISIDDANGELDPANASTNTGDSNISNNNGDDELNATLNSPAEVSETDSDDYENELPASPTKMSETDLSEDEAPKGKSELELLREKSMKEQDAFLASLLDAPEFADILDDIKTLNKRGKKTFKRSSGNVDRTFRSKATIPLERRTSARLQNKSPIFTKDDLVDEKTFKRKRYGDDDDDYADLEVVVYEPRKSRPKRMTVYVPAIAIEDVSENMIKNIARKVSVKILDPESGSTCHQCRQKTRDQKTCCRSSTCVGVRGQFCGVCLENRYGEDASVALKDPNWKCPPCREICNCSFCRAKAGKRPTGILIPQALQAGHKSVKDFLDSLQGEGDYPHQDNLWQKYKNPKYLLGFSKDLNVAHMGGDKQHEVNCNLSFKKFKYYYQRKQLELSNCIEKHNESSNLLGFVKESGNAMMNNNVQYDLQCSVSLEYNKKFIHQMKKEIEVLVENTGLKHSALDI